MAENTAPPTTQDTTAREKWVRSCDKYTLRSYRKIVPRIPLILRETQNNNNLVTMYRAPNPIRIISAASLRPGPDSASIQSGPEQWTSFQTDQTPKFYMSHPVVHQVLQAHPVVHQVHQAHPVHPVVPLSNQPAEETLIMHLKESLSRLKFNDITTFNPQKKAELQAMKQMVAGRLASRLNSKSKRLMEEALQCSNQATQVLVENGLVV